MVKFFFFLETGIPKGTWHLVLLKLLSDVSTGEGYPREKAKIGKQAKFCL